MTDRVRFSESNTGYHLEHRRLAGVPRCRVLGCGKLFSPDCRSHGAQLGSHVHNMWIVLWIVSAARDGDARGARQVANSDLAEVWARSLDGLADLQIQPHQRAWLKLTRPLGLVENTALIATPNEFVKEQLETRLRALVTQALSQELGRDIQLAVTVDPAPQAPVAAGQAPGWPPARPRARALRSRRRPGPGAGGIAGPRGRPRLTAGPPAAAPHAHPAHDGPGEPAHQDQGRPGSARGAPARCPRPRGSAAPG